MAATVKVFWWRWKPPQRLNFGDEITAPLVERITGRTVKWAAPDRCDLIGAGSVMQMLIKRRGDNDPRRGGAGSSTIRISAETCRRSVRVRCEVNELFRTSRAASGRV